MTISLSLSNKIKLLLTGMSLALLSGISLVSEAKVQTISGWPLPDLPEDKPPFWLGNDPVLGRLICPPVSRLNLQKNESEGLFFQSVQIATHPGKVVRWTFAVRSGLYWWDGSEVSPDDLGRFFRAQLSDQVARMSGGLWNVPEFHFVTQGQDLTLTWAAEPEFGPWVLNGASFFRKVPHSAETGLSWECAGVYKPKEHPKGLLLTPSEKYGQAKEALLVSSGSEPLDPAFYEVSYDFKMADKLSVDPSVRSPDKALACKNLIDTPYVSLISWNLDKEPLRQAAFRQTLTNLTPRGALLRAGAGFQGDLISSLIPRSHPAYQSKVWVREFDLEKASETLNKMGFTRPRGDSMRQNSKKEPLRLILASMRKQPGLIEKVIADSFIAVGIQTRISSVHAPVKGQEPDGVITGALLSWPELNFLPEFHSRAKKSFPFWSPGDKDLDKHLEAHAKSLSFGKADIRALGKVHKLLYILEPVTVIMQHKICLEGPRLSSYQVDMKDPDWFRKIVL